MTNKKIKINLGPIGSKSQNDIFAATKSGRLKDKALLKSYIESCKSVYLLGMPGVGKTSLLNAIEIDFEENLEVLYIRVDLKQYLLNVEKETFSQFIISKLKAKLQFKGISNNNYDKVKGTSRVIDFINIVKQNVTESKNSPDISKFAIAIDNIDSITIPILEKVEIPILRDIYRTIDDFKYFGESVGLCVIFCGRRHYYLARESLKNSMENKNNDEITKKLNTYFKILVSSSSYSDIYYLKGFSIEDVSCLIKKTFVIEQSEKSIDSKKDDIQIIAEDIFDIVGNNPKIIVTILNYLLIELLDEKDSKKIIGEFRHKLKRNIISLQPTIDAICKTIWNTTIAKKDYSTICSVAYADGYGQNDIEKWNSSNKANSVDLENKIIRKYESYGIFCRTEQNQIKLFSPLFLNYIRDEKCPKILRHQEIIFFNDQNKDGGSWNEKSGMKNTSEIKGLPKKMFDILNENIGEMVSYKDLVKILYNEDEVNDTNLNRLYQAKSLLIKKLENIEGLRLKSIPKQGYSIILDNQD